jgi:hypothetical protein
MKRFPVRLISPEELAGGEAGPFPIEQFHARCLAQGDSWFSIGSIPFFLTSNLLQHLELNVGTCIVNCATPGAKLSRMTDTTRSNTFHQLLHGALATKWDAVLVSGGGNDLIEASQSMSPDIGRRLLRLPQEWGAPELGALRFVSDAGWLTFADHMAAVFEQLVAARDADVNRGTPIVFHTYDLPAPRDAAAGPGFGPWLFKALTSFQIPQGDWDGVVTELFSRLRTLLLKLQTMHPNLVVVDSMGTLTPAFGAGKSPTDDWENEIHPTRGGYGKLDDRWVPVLEQVLA